MQQSQYGRVTKTAREYRTEFVRREQGGRKQVPSVQFIFFGMALLYVRSALLGSSLRCPGLKGGCSYGGCMAVCSGFVWKKLSTILSVVSTFSSGRTLGPCPEKRSFRPSFKTRSSLDAIVLKVNCFHGSAPVLPAGMHSSSSRVHIWIPALLSPLPLGHPTKISSSLKLTFPC